MVEFYEKEFDIRVHHCDRYGFLRPAELFKFMQDCAMTHAELMGVGMAAMHEMNSTFVLSRMKIDIIAMPSYGDKLKIKTYPAGIEKIFYIREFDIRCRGAQSAKARSLWLVIDIHTRRPVRNREFGRNFPEVKNPDVEMSSPARPRCNKQDSVIMEKSVVYSDVDILGHANNTSYVAWTCDCLGSEFFEDNPSYTITINYSSELKEGECVRIISENMTFCGIDGTGGEAFSAKVERNGNVQD